MQRLKTYKSRLILFPRKSGQHKKLDSKEEDVKLASDNSKIARKIGRVGGGGVLPIDSGVGIKHGFSEVKKGEMPEGTENAYAKLRNLRADARYVGVRAKRAKAKEEAEDAKKK